MARGWARRGASGGRGSIRGRLLAIAWIPGITLLVLGVGLAGTLAHQGNTVRAYGKDRGNFAEETATLFAIQQQERALTLQQIAAPQDSDRDALLAARARYDSLLQELSSTIDDLLKNAPEATQRQSEQMRASAVDPILQMRQAVDAGRATAEQADQLYSGIIGQSLGLLHLDAARAPTSQVAAAQLQATETLSIWETLAHAVALTTLATHAPGLTEEQYQLYVSLVGTYRTALAGVSPGWTTSSRQVLQNLQASPAWETLGRVEATIMHAQPRIAGGTVHYRADLPVEGTVWDSLSSGVQSSLGQIYRTEYSAATRLASDRGRDELVRSLLVAAAILLLTLVVLFVSTRLSTTLIRRLRGLRDLTLELADVRLPAMVDRLRAGEAVDVEQELTPLEHSRDEIGQVAEAFEKAERTAVGAAAAEAENRAGTGRVFLNIARRSQVIVHRQLKVLDQAERSQEDPDQLMLLFELDHLATRARRNAENLIILGGGQPGRQWRNPVPLVEMVRSAVGESERYARVVTGRLPDLRVDGGAVADLIHLLAELVDNATSYSPPSSRVEVRGNLVGRGMVLEIEDQGLGIEPDLQVQLNEMLHEPPDFSMMALADEPRMGLFVVARLAARHGVTVTLLDSPSYGGTKAVVLLPAVLLSPGRADAELTEGPGRTSLPSGGTGDLHINGSARHAVPTTAPNGVGMGTSLFPPPAPPSPGSAFPVPETTRFADDADGVTDGVIEPETGSIPVMDVEPEPEPGPAPAAPKGGADRRPVLPRRVRQAHLSPQLMDAADVDDVGEGPAGTVRDGGAERSRNRFAALQRGTRRGRTDQSEGSA